MIVKLFFMFLNISPLTYSQTTGYEPIGASRDDNNCLISAGYSWCRSSKECVRLWETPCQDNFVSCNDCLNEQRNGINIACPESCDIVTIDPVYHSDLEIPVPDTPVPDTPVPVQPVVRRCSEVMCMMYCPNGHQLDEYGCQMCQCIDPPPTQSQECPLTQPTCEGYNFVCPKITEITHCNLGGINGHTTYQLSLVIQDNKNVKNIYAIYGDSRSDSSNDEGFVMRFPPVYQSPIYQGQNLGGVSEYMTGLFPDTSFDSWLTIGLTTGDPQGTISSIGVDFSKWDESSSLDVDNGAVFLMDPSDIDLSSQGQEIIIAQLTIPTYTSPTIIVNAQGKTLDYDLNDISDKSWTEKNILFPIIPPVYIVPGTVPVNCNSWFDGCNTCSANNGIIGVCTRMMCFREETPRCLQYSDATPGH